MAGVVSAVKKRTTKNNSLMAYVTLEDDSGSMELICFQRALDNGGSYIQDNAALLVRGRISVRDEKEPQIMADTIRPLSDLDAPGHALAPKEKAPEPPQSKKLFLRLDSTNAKAMRRVELLLTMFPGDDPLVIYFPDIKKQRSARCIIHPALVSELKELYGDDNVVVK